jgi:hypothetical protein
MTLTKAALPWLVALSIGSSGGFLFAASDTNSSRRELELLESFFGEREYELSGIAAWRQGFLIISDNNTDTSISEIRMHRGRFLIESRFDLTKLDGFTKFKDDALAKAKLLGHDRWLDLEAISVCGDTIYLANERIRQIVVIDKGKIRGLEIDFSSVPQIMLGDANAGFEGLAVDCATDQMWIAKERDPRGIVTVDLKTLKVSGFVEIPPSDRGGQRVLEWRNGNGVVEIGADFGDLQFVDGSLYALERNHYEVARLDAKTLQVLDRVSFFKSSYQIYDTGEPFGLGEALWVEPESLWVGMDNNGMPLGTRAVAQFRVSGPMPGLFKFKRPSNPKF